MAVKLTVSQIAKAKEDLAILSKAVSDAAMKLDEHKANRVKYSAAYERLNELVRILNQSEVTVKG